MRPARNRFRRHDYLLVLCLAGSLKPLVLEDDALLDETYRGGILIPICGKAYSRDSGHVRCSGGMLDPVFLLALDPWELDVIHAQIQMPDSSLRFDGVRDLMLSDTQLPPGFLDSFPNVKWIAMFETPLDARSLSQLTSLEEAIIENVVVPSPSLLASLPHLSHLDLRCVANATEVAAAVRRVHAEAKIEIHDLTGHEVTPGACERSR